MTGLGRSGAEPLDGWFWLSPIDTLLDAMKRCWASLWNSRAVAYRDQHGISHDDVALAVVVQELVDADAAGVLFAADPVTGARGETVINASWGLVEAVVAGQLTPDTLVVSNGVSNPLGRRGQSCQDGAHRCRDQGAPDPR